MSGNAQKTPFASSINDFARQKAGEAIKQTGRSLPCSVVKAQGSIVQVKFEVQSAVFTLPNVTIPVGSPEYVRWPLQPGDKGFVVAADAYLGGMSGLGGGVAGLGQQANLSALVFVPLGNTGFFSVDGNALVLYGPNGVVLHDSQKHTTATLTPTSLVVSVSDGGTTLTMTATSIVLKAGGTILQIDASGIKANGNIFGNAGSAAQVDLLQHVHTGVQGGTGTTAPPRPGS